jgi:branched-chain amino acid transport system substrate-binding protein
MFIRTKMLSLTATVAAVATAVALMPARADDAVKIGLILPMTGGQASTGKQIDNAVKLYMQQHGDTVAGRKIEVILKDDAAVPDNTKRLAQELIVNDKVNFIAGFGVTPAALAAAPLATQAKIPEIVMAAGTSIITERSPYIVRTSFTLAQSSTIIGDWAVKNGIKKVATLTSDYAPGNDALNFFKQNFTAGGGEIVEEVKVPLANPDFAPFLQRMKDAKPDAMFVFVPAGQGGNFMKQYAERGLDKAGIKVIGPGDVMDDDLLNGMGDAALGTVTAHLYSAAHPSAMNKEFVAAYKKAFSNRPGFMAVSGYDGINLIYQALKNEVGKPARPDLDRSGNPRHRAEHLYPQGREGRRRTLQRRIPDLSGRQGFRQDQEVTSTSTSFRGAGEASEPGISKLLRRFRVQRSRAAPE